MRYWLHARHTRYTRRLTFVILAWILSSVVSSAAERPNILLIVADDWGYGDLGVHGNPVIQTPRLDAFTHESAQLRHFSASPIGAPSRASLVTGLYSHRTGVVDSIQGRSLLRPDIRTLSERLRQVGYRTGAFGKWHLGDNYPLRPEDRGFESTLWLRGEGLGSAADHPNADPKTAYDDPYLVQNGQDVRAKGYCTDVFADAAIDFVTQDEKKPFFALVAFNAPHPPFQCPEADLEPFRELKQSLKSFPSFGQPWFEGQPDVNELQSVYGMIANLDRNCGRIFDALEESGLANNTIVVVLSDNGPTTARYNAGLRQRKGSVYEGGLRVPCYVRWPEKIPAGRVIDEPTAPIDIMPTLLAAAEVIAPSAKQPFDGRNLLPLLIEGATNWTPRTLFFQWHRHDAPERYRSFAVRGPRYKLVQSMGNEGRAPWFPRFELFDLRDDPFEDRDLSLELPDLAAQMRVEYNDWFTDVTRGGFEPVRIHIGNVRENPTRLSRLDSRADARGEQRLGQWELFVEREGTYRLTMISKQPFTAVSVAMGQYEVQVANERAESVRTKSMSLKLPSGKVTLRCMVQNGLRTWGPDYVEIEHLAK